MHTSALFLARGDSPAFSVRWREATGEVPPYASTEDGRIGAGVEGTRASDALKLRLALLQMGRRRYEEVIRHGFELAERVEEDIFLSLPSLRVRRWLRAVLLNPFTDVDTVARMLAAVDRFVAERSSP